jgi:DNA-binding IclR family transcriptional regulator
MLPCLQPSCALRDRSQWTAKPTGKGDGLEERASAGVQSVERAIRILKAFSPEAPERSVGELSQDLGLHKSTVSRLMSTLERGGLLSRNPQTLRYRLGIDLIGMAGQVVSHIDVREVARPVLRQLAQECQESVNLVVMDQGQVVNLEQFVAPSRQVKNIGKVGRRTPPHCTAAGKVLMANSGERQVERILARGLERYTPHTIANPASLREELMVVRERGYATAQEELEQGLNAVAVPICDHKGQTIAAASVAGPEYRVTPELFPWLAAQLRAAAGDISERLGYQRQREPGSRPPC